MMKFMNLMYYFTRNKKDWVLATELIQVAIPMNLREIYWPSANHDKASFSQIW